MSDFNLKGYPTYWGWMAFFRHFFTYFVDDILGGYYGQRAGYGANYYLEGNISIADDGTVTLNSSFCNGWGDSAKTMTGGKWDAATKTFTWCTVYANMDFNVIMTKE